VDVFKQVGLVFTLEIPKQPPPFGHLWEVLDEAITTRIKDHRLPTLPIPPVQSRRKENSQASGHTKTRWDFVQCVESVHRKTKVKKLMLVPRRSGLSLADYQIDTIKNRFGIRNPILEQPDDELTQMVMIGMFSPNRSVLLPKISFSAPRYRGFCCGSIDSLYHDDLSVHALINIPHACYVYRLLWDMSFNGKLLNDFLEPILNECRDGKLSECPPSIDVDPPSDSDQELEELFSQPLASSSRRSANPTTLTVTNIPSPSLVDIYNNFAILLLTLSQTRSMVKAKVEFNQRNHESVEDPLRKAR